MDIILTTPKDKQLINRYGNGGFVINDVSYTGNVIILGEQVLQWQGELTAEHLEPIFKFSPLPEIFIFGTGKEFAPHQPELRTLFRSHNIGFDAMDTGAACRTYNVLVSEARLVTTALIAV